MSYLFDALFVIEEGWQRGAVRAHPFSRLTASEVIQIFLGQSAPKRPLEFTVDEGSRFLDVLGTTDAVIRLLSARLVGVLRAAELTGWQTFPVRIRNSPLMYFGLAVTGKAGPLLPKATRVETAPPYRPGLPPRRVVRGIYFDPATWDGSDFCCPDGSTYVIGTRRVKEVLESNHVTNCSIQPMTEVEQSLLDSEIASLTLVDRPEQ